MNNPNQHNQPRKSDSQGTNSPPTPQKPAIVDAPLAPAVAPVIVAPATGEPPTAPAPVVAPGDNGKSAT